MSCDEPDQGDLDRPRRRAQFSIEDTLSSTNVMLLSPLDDYVVHNRASRRKTSFGSLRLQCRKDLADRAAAIVVENPSLSYLAAASIVADEYNVDIVD